MNVYDFDGTIYDGDSTVDFYVHCMVRHPALVWTVLPNALNAIRHRLGLISREEFKEGYFSLLLPRIDSSTEVADFWSTRRNGIKEWYLLRRANDDVVASASPEFLLAPICRELGARLIATDVDPSSGVFRGPNMRGEAKTDAFRERFPGCEPDAFFTDDAEADAPMISMAKTAYLVKGEAVSRISGALGHGISAERD